MRLLDSSCTCLFTWRAWDGILFWYFILRFVYSFSVIMWNKRKKKYEQWYCNHLCLLLCTMLNICSSSKSSLTKSFIQRDGVVFISGDVHYGEIARYDCGIGYSLYDITSSGLTQAVEKAVLPPLWFIVRVGAWLTPTTMRVFNQKCRYRSCAHGMELNWQDDVCFHSWCLGSFFLYRYLVIKSHFMYSYHLVCIW